MSSETTSERSTRLATIRPAASFARAISWGFWWRRLLSWLAVDLELASVFSLLFCWHCTSLVPVSSLDGITYKLFSTSIVKPSASTLLLEGNRVASWIFRITGSDGATFDFALLPYLQIITPCLGFLAIWQLVDLLGFFSDTRRVRRKLQPLNDLAVAAEAIGNVTAATDPMASEHDKMATLEQAIERASVDSPTVSTGDRDLRSIEVALNGLLRQMQEAKLQQMRFVSDASHELRTPIAVIQGYVNMLDRWGKTDEAVLDESIDALKTESAHMKELVEQLLFLARGDSGRNTLNLADVNVAQVVYEVWEESRMIDDTHVYECNVGEGDLNDPRQLVEGDAGMLKQALRIMVQNAQKYSPEGSTITLSARSGTHEVCFSVQDEGIGMSETDVKHIFERFYRANEVRNNQTDGSGLGLSIAKWIVDAHNGTIEVVSREGVGTRFTVRLKALDR